ncbi:MAG: hypothetical protein K0R98_480 [Rickettsiaceae bacterium]|nr:hypothetical protein [Rickettsiaceae bacterium]
MLQRASTALPKMLTWRLLPAYPSLHNLQESRATARFQCHFYLITRAGIRYKYLLAIGSPDAISHAA